MNQLKRYEVWLIDHGVNKIGVIRAVRHLTWAGLKETKDFVEAAPGLLFTDVSLATAQEAYELLEGEGAMVEIRQMTEGYTIVY